MRATTSRQHRLAVLCLALYALGQVYTIAGLVAGVKLNFMLVGASTIVFFFFSLLHAGLALGVRRTAVFVAITFTVSLLFELLGTANGWIYGAYSYTHRLGPKVLGLVPLIIPLAWFMMIYASYVLANVIGLGTPRADARSLTLPRLLWLVLLSTFIMTSWDLLNDPINVHAGHWVWVEDGAFFGIPLSNYAGWLLTAFVVYLLFWLYDRWQPAPLPAVSCRAGDAFAWLPVVGFAVTLAANVVTLVANGQEGPALAGFFSMGAFLAAALSRRA